MRLRTFTAATMPEAMELVRLDMGDDAIIVSTEQSDDENSYTVSAAIEDEPEIDAEIAETELTAEEVVSINPQTRLSFLRQVLMAHGLPQHVLEPLIRSADILDNIDATMALAAAIDDRVDFSPIEFSGQPTPIMLAGPPGTGKTITAAKLAARAKLNGHSVFIATTDIKRAGGIEQLQAFTRILDLDLVAVDGARELKLHIAQMQQADVAIIDTSGVNPFDEDDMQLLHELASAANAEIMLVLAAGADAMESADTARAFSDLGAKRMVISRLDMTRRLGGILAAALVGRMAIANVSINPSVADGLSQINPVSLAHLIVPEDEADDQSRTKVAQ